MTILEKIKNLTWFDLINSLKSILSELESSSSGTSISEAPEDGLQYARQDATWKEVTGGEDSQDLQNVIDEGGYAESSDGFSYVAFYNPAGEMGEIRTTLAVGSETFNSQVTIQDRGIGLDYSGETDSAQINMLANFGIEMNYATNGFSTRVTIDTPLGNSTIKFPTPTATGVYILATLDDIPSSPITGTFANPTSITVVNGLITEIS